MKRTISAMVGKGAVNHNERKFHAKNTDPSRTKYNITYRSEDIKEVYHQLFDKALENYNAKQKRADRIIPDYYEKIRSGKQEKPFHELIIQIGNKDDTAADSQNGELAKQILDEYMKLFQERNPNLRVFSAHLHMDEATPHLHIDFVPFTTGSKRGLETRVSLKKALETQGFRGGTRSDTEWDQWVNAEKEQLAAIMLEYGIEWERLGTHEKHLSVLDFKKKERAKEVAALDAQVQVLTAAVSECRGQVAELDEQKERRQVEVEELDVVAAERVEEIVALDRQKTDKQTQIDSLNITLEEKQAETVSVEQTLDRMKKKKVRIREVENIEVKPTLMGDSVKLSKKDYETLSIAAKKYIAQEKKESRLQQLLDAANAKIRELQETVKKLLKRISDLEQELRQYTSFEAEMEHTKIEVENQNLKRENQELKSVLQSYGIMPRQRHRNTQRSQNSL